MQKLMDTNRTNYPQQIYDGLHRLLSLVPVPIARKAMDR